MATNTATKRKPKRTRGIRCWFRGNRPNAPYCVQRRVGDGKKLTESFKTAEDRDRRAQQWADESSDGRLAEAPSREEMLEFRAFKTALGDTDWRDVIAAFRRTNLSTITADAMFTSYERWQHERVKAGRLDEAVKKRNVKLASAFADEHKGVKASEMTREGLSDWIDDHYDGSPAPSTFNRALSTLRTMWDKSEQPNNLFEKIETRTRPGGDEEVRVLPVADAEKLFAFGFKYHPWLMPKIALEAFVGIRFGSVGKLPKERIDFAGKKILLTAGIIKTRKRRVIEMIEPNVWSWMALATDQTWSISERQYLDAKSKLFIKAGVPHPHNCFRHSACSYHVSAFDSPSRTALMLCHSNERQVWSTYNGAANKADGIRYYSITTIRINQMLDSGDIKLPELAQAATCP